jgi:8-amino-7-oxononanoate synthase
MVNWDNFIAKQIAKLPRLRNRIAKIGGNSRYLLTNSQQFRNFVSNDYLGLSSEPAIIDAFHNACKIYGLGSSGAPSLSGYSEEHQLLSEEIARWLEYERCLLFSSGYQLNISIFSQLIDKNTYIWLDKNCHASHIDGVLMAKAKFSRFSVHDIQDMSNKIKEQTNLLHIIISEGSFSMDGTCYYLEELIKLKQAMPANVLLVIDDAHGIGALGAKGYGTLEQLGLDLKAVDLIIGTFGKAFGTHGGFVCGSSAIIEYLEQSVRSQIFSTNLPPAMAAATRCALAIINSPHGLCLRAKLIKNIQYFQQLIDEMGLKLYNRNLNQSPIQLIVSDNQETVIRTHQNLLNHRLLVGKILYPTVPKTAPRLRISLNKSHQKSDIEQLIESLTRNRL